jgi:gamma-glutamyl phosphate reductase
MSTKEYFEQKARQARRLLHGINDPQAREALTAMAEEFDAKAAVIDAEESAKVAAQRCIDLMGNGEPGPTFTGGLNGKDG